MPGWSTEIANQFIALAAAEDRALDQLQLQGLVYIAHGFCLSRYNKPLTGDRPEAWKFGPVYVRLADAFAHYGLELVTREISKGEAFPEAQLPDCQDTARPDLEEFEQSLVGDVFRNFGSFEAWQLSALTRKHDAAPWESVFANGAGEFREISPKAIRTQFESFAAIAIAEELTIVDEAAGIEPPEVHNAGRPPLHTYRATQWLRPSVAADDPSRSRQSRRLACSMRGTSATLRRRRRMLLGYLDQSWTNAKSALLAHRPLP